MTALNVDGAAWSLPSDGTRLSTALRQRGVTAVKVGCEQGACGSCTVLIDGTPTASCLVPVARVDGSTIRTTESLLDTPEGRRVAESFARHSGFQCGFCTPGIVTTVTALALQNRAVSLEELRDALRSHLCRCTGYVPILAAARSALSSVKGMS